MILIAIGANLPGLDGKPPIAACEAAVAELQTLPDLSFAAISSWYRNAAVPASSQPDFCNGVVRLEGDIAPEKLLEALHDIENRHGRVRSVPDAPRRLDLDIIDLNGTIRVLPPPILPHPRAHLRGFVLRPILDVAPEWRHPALRRSITSLLVDLAPQPIEPWEKE